MAIIIQVTSNNVQTYMHEWKSILQGAQGNLERQLQSFQYPIDVKTIRKFETKEEAERYFKSIFPQWSYKMNPIDYVEYESVK